jgi:hypothetical protein
MRLITSSISLMTRAPTLSMRSVVLIWERRLVDDLVERSVVSGRVDVPDLVIAGHRGLPQRPDLAKRHFRERHGAFMFIQNLDHCVPNPGILPVVSTGNS